MEVDKIAASNHEEPDSDQKQILKSRFDLDNFRDEQWQAINSLIYQKRDCFLVANSRYPKDIIYQFPAMCSDKITIVFSALSSSIDKQIEILKEKQIKSCVLRTKADKATLEHEKIIIVNLDERLKQVTSYMKILHEMKQNIGLIVINECHCISKLSYRFRQSFSSLEKLKNKFPSVPFLCLSSNATKRVQDDVSSILGLVDPIIIQTCLDHPNVELKLKHRPTKEDMKEIRIMIGDLTDDCAIIVVHSRSDADKYAAYFRDHFDIAAGSFHSGLNKTQRKSVAEDFHNNLTPVMFVTDYFSELHRNDIRVIIYLSLPKTIDKIYEIFDAIGRDGKSSKCIISYEQSDFHLLSLNQSRDELLFEYEELKSEELKKFAEQKTKCRRMLLLLHYNQTTNESVTREKCCDVCDEKIFSVVPMNLLFHGLNEQGMLDISDDSRDFLTLTLHGKHQFSQQRIVDFLRGIFFDTAHTLPLQFFGKGSKKPQEYWANLINFLAAHEMISNVFVFRVSKKGKSFCYMKSQTLIANPKQHNFVKFLKRTDKEFIIENNVYRCINVDTEMGCLNDYYEESATTSNKAIKRKFPNINEDLFAFSKQSKRIKNEAKSSPCDNDSPMNADNLACSEDSDDEYVGNIHAGRVVDADKTKEYFAIGNGSMDFDTDDD